MRSCELSLIAGYLRVGRQLIFDCKYASDTIFNEANFTKFSNFYIVRRTNINIFRSWQLLSDKFLNSDKSGRSNWTARLCIIHP